MRGPLILCSMLALAACGGGSGGLIAGPKARFQCENGLKLVAHFPDGEQLVLEGAGPRATMTRVQAMSGTKYADAGQTFWIRGNQAFYESSQGMVRCMRTDN